MNLMTDYAVFVHKLHYIINGTILVSFCAQN